MSDCTWIEMTDNYQAKDGTWFLAGRQYKFMDSIFKEKESIGCKEECMNIMEHFVVCLDDKYYDIPTDVAIYLPKGNTRPKDEEDGIAWRNKYRTDKSDWMKEAELALGSFPKRQGKAIDLRKYKELLK